MKLPLFKITKNQEQRWLFIAARDAQSAIAEASNIWAAKNNALPQPPTTYEVKCECLGTMDYIPAIATPYHET
jgi:hypothetical protein